MMLVNIALAPSTSSLPTTKDTIFLVSDIVIEDEQTLPCQRGIAYFINATVVQVTQPFKHWWFEHFLCLAVFYTAESKI